MKVPFNKLFEIDSNNVLKFIVTVNFDGKIVPTGVTVAGELTVELNGKNYKIKDCTDKEFEVEIEGNNVYHVKAII